MTSEKTATNISSDERALELFVPTPVSALKKGDLVYYLNDIKKIFEEKRLAEPQIGLITEVNRRANSYWVCWLNSPEHDDYDIGEDVFYRDRKLLLSAEEYKILKANS